MVGVCQICGQVKNDVGKRTLTCTSCYQANYRSKNKNPPKQKKAEAFSKPSLVEIIRLVKGTHRYLLDDAKYRADQLDGERSDELKAAIKMQEILDMI